MSASRFKPCERCGHPRELHLGDAADDVAAFLLKDAGCLCRRSFGGRGGPRCTCVGYRDAQPGKEKAA